MTVGNKNIGPTVVVHIKKRRAPANVGKSWEQQPGFRADIVKPLRAAIVKKRRAFLAEVGNNDAVASAVVEVRDIHSHRSMQSPFAGQGRS